jgi:hypothetical protein
MHGRRWSIDWSVYLLKNFLLFVLLHRNVLSGIKEMLIGICLRTHTCLETRWKLVHVTLYNVS